MQRYLAEKLAYLTKNTDKKNVSSLMEQPIATLPFVPETYRDEKSLGEELKGQVHFSRVTLKMDLTPDGPDIQFRIYTKKKLKVSKVECYSA